MVETWKPVAGYERHYEVSSEGQARRISPAQNTFPGRLLKPHTARHGYKRFAFAVENTVKHCNAHRVVWEAFVGPIAPGLQINHKNGVKDDNRLSNLEVVTPSENTLHGFRVLGRQGVRNPMPGSKHGNSKLTEADLPKMIALRQSGLSQQKIATLFGVDQTTVSRILLGKAWTHVADRPLLRARPAKD
jgi:hypothetical protein